jgi:hypothetical protein
VSAWFCFGRGKGRGTLYCDYGTVWDGKEDIEKHTMGSESEGGMSWECVREDFQTELRRESGKEGEFVKSLGLGE